MANMLMLETNKYAIKIDNFEGPLDLLCHLIDKNKMDIYDINLREKGRPAYEAVLRLRGAAASYDGSHRSGLLKVFHESHGIISHILLFF